MPYRSAAPPSTRRRALVEVLAVTAGLNTLVTCAAVLAVTWWR